MSLLKRLLVVVSLSVGGVAAIPPLPASAQDTSRRDAEALIDRRIALLSRGIVDASSVLGDPDRSSSEKDRAADLITQNAVRVAILRGTRAGFVDRSRPTFQILEEHFLSIAGPNTPYPDR